MRRPGRGREGEGKGGGEQEGGGRKEGRRQETRKGKSLDGWRGVACAPVLTLQRSLVALEGPGLSLGTSWAPGGPQAEGPSLTWVLAAGHTFTGAEGGLGPRPAVSRGNWTRAPGGLGDSRRCGEGS